MFLRVFGRHAEHRKETRSANRVHTDNKQTRTLTLTSGRFVKHRAPGALQ